MSNRSEVYRTGDVAKLTVLDEPAQSWKVSLSRCPGKNSTNISRHQRYVLRGLGNSSFVERWRETLTGVDLRESWSRWAGVKE